MHIDDNVCKPLPENTCKLCLIKITWKKKPDEVILGYCTEECLSVNETEQLFK